MSLSTITPEKLPTIENLRRLTKSIAMLDAIICPEWEYRYYSYNSKWAENEEMASMRNGCGDEWFLLFDSIGAAMKGLAHEFPLVKDISFAVQIQKMVPPAFSSFLQEPAFKMKEATFCIWRQHTDAIWYVVAPKNADVSPANDGSAELFAIFDGQPTTYHAWAEAYYERAISLPAIEAIYGHQALTESIVAKLNSELSLSQVVPNALEINYPCELGS